MRYFDQGAVFRVTVSRREVEDFAARWPCFGTARALSFTFDGGGGGLVDLAGDRGMDAGGVAALSEDAHEYGQGQRGAGSLYTELVAAGIQTDSHESDLYFPATEASRAVLKRIGYSGALKTFTDQVGGGLWFDAPFAFTPWWEKRGRHVG